MIIIIFTINLSIVVILWNNPFIVRERVVWINNGLITVTGGKLTTFRRLAIDALKATKPYLPSDAKINRKAPAFGEVPDKPLLGYGLTPQIWRRLYGRFCSIF